MTGVAPLITLSPLDYDAVLFDLDGVLTRTASVHASAWKKLFDGFLEHRAINTGGQFVPFDIDSDYLRYVDGKPRYDGVASFLQSRGINLPPGAPEDASDVQSVRALGRRLPSPPIGSRSGAAMNALPCKPPRWGFAMHSSTSRWRSGPCDRSSQLTWA